MANKRMFTKKITETDAFLDMPLSAQALYFHICMNADDDGFLGSPKKVMRWIGASQDDLKLLIAKRFLLEFEDGVVVVKHWWMHNQLRSDMYTKTNYDSELNQLFIKENRSYSRNSGIPVEGNIVSLLGSTSNKKRNRSKTVTKAEQKRNETVVSDLELDIDIDLDIDKELEVDVEVEAPTTNIFTVYESTGRMLNSMDTEKLSDLESDFGTEWVCQAINRASDRGIVNIGYITGILNSWRQNGGIDDPKRKHSSTADMLQESYNMMAEWAAEDN